MHHHPHHIIANLLHLLAGGGLGLFAAGLAMAYGWRSADRLPGESRTPQCVYCYRPFTWQEIFPLIGWLLRPDTLSFHCPCGLRKGLWQQPACEIMGFILGLYAMYLQDWSLAAVPLCLGLGLLPAMALIDFHFGIIPDGHNILLGLFGILFVLIGDGDIYLSVAVAAALLCLGLFFALVYSKWRGREMLGLGDVKFFAASGFWLHAHSTPWFLMLGGFVGIGFNLLWRRAGGGKQFPFAPALCVALALCVFYQLAFLQ
jgi:leader peptidase (prepilin peptidase)/N-methyltransferase